MQFCCFIMCRGSGVIWCKSFKLNVCKNLQVFVQFWLNCFQHALIHKLHVCLWNEGEFPHQLTQVTILVYEMNYS
jgi:hypothetical protein